MHRVKFISNICIYPNLTIGKIYDVIDLKKYNSHMFNKLVLLDDSNAPNQYYIYYNDVELFEDVTITEYRNEIINDILDYEKG